MNGERTGNLVRFLPDGTRDSTFELDEELHACLIRAIAEAPAGKFVASCIGPDLNSRVVRLNADGSIDRSFDAGPGSTPNANGRSLVEALAVDAAGRVLVGGQFGDFNGSGRPNFLRLTAEGSVDTSFSPVHLRLDVNVSPGAGLLTDRSIAIQPDGKILIGGFFSHVNEVPRLSVARFLDDGTLDPDFVPSGYNPATPTSNSTSKRPVHAVALQPHDGKIVIGGTFNPTTTTKLAQPVVRLNPGGSADPAFKSPASTYPPPCVALTLLSSGDILATDNVKLRRLRPDGSADTAFNSKVPYVSSGRLLSVAKHSDGKALFAGRIFDLAGAQYSGVGRLAADGSLETAFRPGELQREYLPDQIARRSDGNILISGGFDRVDGAPHAQLALLDSRGAVATPMDLEDVLWAPFYLQPDDKLMRWGYVPIGSPQFFVRRLHADGSRDTSFTAAPETIDFESMELQSTGQYVLSTGNSTQAVASGVLASRLNPDGSADPSFDLGIDEAQLVTRGEFNFIIEMWDGDNRVLAVLPGDKLLYKYFDRDAKYKVVLLGPNGDIDKSFHGGTATAYSTTLAFPLVLDPVTGRTYQPEKGVTQPSSVGPRTTFVDSDGSIVLAGQFTSYNSEPVGGIVRLRAGGSVQSTFGTGAALSASPANAGREPFITDIQRDFAGRLLLVGDFDSFDGHPSPGIARLNADDSVDTTFKPPVARRTTGIPLNHRSHLTRQSAGRFLLSGNYAASEGSSTATSIFRLKIPVRATGMARTANTLQLQFTGVPGETYKLQSSPALGAAPFQDSGPVVQAAPDGSFTYEDATAFGSLQRFYRAVQLE